MFCHQSEQTAKGTGSLAFLFVLFNKEYGHITLKAFVFLIRKHRT